MARKPKEMLRSFLSEVEIQLSLSARWENICPHTHEYFILLLLSSLTFPVRHSCSHLRNHVSAPPLLVV